jgi:hypothetical protein
MQSIHSIQTVTGPTLAIEVPPAFQGKQVEVVITAVEAKAQSHDEILAAKLKRLAMEKPPLSPELQKRLTENPDLLTGSVLFYEDPFGPACPPEDWEVLS